MSPPFPESLLPGLRYSASMGFSGFKTMRLLASAAMSMEGVRKPLPCGRIEAQAEAPPVSLAVEAEGVVHAL